MKTETPTLQAKRSKLFSDFYNNIMPERMPVTMDLSFALIAEYGGLNTIDFQYDYSKLRDPAMDLAKKGYSDGPICRPPVSLGATRSPLHYQLLGSQSFVMGNKGFMQHPEVSGMKDTEYPELIADPFTFLVEKVLPRQYKNLNPENPAAAMMYYSMSEKAMNDDILSGMPWYLEMIHENEFYPGPPRGSFISCDAPFDFIADELRGFSGISKDIRRHRSEIKEAVEAILPLMFHWGLPSLPHPEGAVFTPLHMPTFMREKDFADLWFPTYKTMLEQFAAKGARVLAFCEDDWTRYLDYLQDLPAGTHLKFEYGDPQTIKDKLGDKFIIQGLYPLSLLKQGTKQQCIDKAKELLDIMMPGGGYLFDFDKGILGKNDVNMENLFALYEFLHEYGVNDNPGTSYGTPLNSEGFVFDENLVKPIHSKYFLDWETFKSENPLAPNSVKGRLEQYNKQFIDRILGLLY